MKPERPKQKTVYTVRWWDIEKGAWYMYPRLYLYYEFARAVARRKAATLGHNEYVEIVHYHEDGADTVDDAVSR